jgi:hypothetical protein
MSSCHSVGGKGRGCLDLGGLAGILDLESRYQMGQGHRLLEDVSAEACWLVDEIGSVQVQDVKQECRQWSSRAGHHGVDTAGGTRTGLLKRSWPPIVVQRDELTIEDQTMVRQ